MDQIGWGFAIDYTSDDELYVVLWHGIAVKQFHSYDAAYDFVAKVLKSEQLELQTN